ncbi:hypothetical protein SKAU_G00157460 [Synaphobranchus kaupii]|uniref:ribonuclease H n=1 Tax=Synaphobranchus kaupii TaxID=118154 RepID=A0A9Q1IYJ3_SYNKA|nr:hypothetical protein SKAU_G00157460 [Synaphobranchus kaupii]
MLEPPATFNDLVITAIRLDNRIRERERERSNHSILIKSTLPRGIPPSFSTYPSADQEEPLQVDGSSLHQPRRARPRAYCRQYCKYHAPDLSEFGSDSDSEEAESHDDSENSLSLSESGEESLAWDHFAEGGSMEEGGLSTSDFEWDRLSDTSSGAPEVVGALEFALPAGVPAEYSDLAEVFSKQRATRLPPHRLYDCAIELYPASAVFFFVKKKDEGLRPCIDYRGLSDITIKNRYPLPLMNSTFEHLQGASVFSKLDLRNAYNLVCISEGDEWKTAFNTHHGHYEYRVMPFGLTSAPSVFQALVNDVLREMLEKSAFVYLDDI